MITGRLALVTGGAAGIGAAIALRLRAAGARVVVADVSAAAGDRFTAEHGIPAYACDVAQFDQVEALQETLAAGHGTVEILVNNAGITRDAMVHRMAREQWDAVLSVNLGAVFNTIRCFAPAMREGGWGRIVNISSMSGQKGNLGQANYAAAKAGMIGLTKTVALEMAGKGVTANCVAPGFILTDMTRAMPAERLAQEQARIPAGRLGAPEDIAGAVAYLASEEASFVTGHVLAVNGGQYT